MRQLHLTRALLAAGITLAMSGALPFVCSVIESILSGRGFPSGADLGWIIKEQPLIFLYFALLLVLLSIPMAILWRIDSPRRTLSTPWMASVCGCCVGILLSPPWYVGLRAVDGYDLSRISLSGYLDIIDVIVPFAAITGALYFFLHSFFIRQALGKKEWLETRA